MTLAGRRPRDPGHRHAGVSGSSACGVCGKDSIAEALGVRPRPRRWTGALPDARRRTRAARACCASGQRVFDAHRRRARGRRCSTADGELLVVREDVGRHNAVDKVTGARRAGRRSPAAAVPGASAAGPASSWCRRRWPPASARWSRSAPRPASRCGWPEEAGLGALRLHLGPAVRALHLSPVRPVGNWDTRTPGRRVVRRTVGAAS